MSWQNTQEGRKQQRVASVVHAAQCDTQTVLAGIGGALKKQNDYQAIQHAALNISILLGGSEAVYDLQ